MAGGDSVVLELDFDDYTEALFEMMLPNSGSKLLDGRSQVLSMSKNRSCR